MKKKKSYKIKNYLSMNQLVINLKFFIYFSNNFVSFLLVNSSTISRPLSNTIIINPFERLRPMDIQPRTEELSLQIFDQPSFPINQDEISSKITQSILPQDQFDENNDSSTSTTTNRSIHLPVEKQRGLSEIIRKRNSKSKVEDYKRSIQKSNTFEDQQTLLILKNEPELPLNPITNENKRAQMSIERLNLLLTKAEQEEYVEEKKERNLFVYKF